MIEKNTILFDLDGTLVDSILDIKHSIDTMLLRYNLPEIELVDLRNIIGRGFPTTVKESLDLFISDPKRARLLKEDAIKITLNAYSENHGKHTQIYPHVRKTLDHLKLSQFKMAVVTNKEEKHALSLLKHLDLLKYFPVVVGGDSTPYYKPHKAPIEKALSLLKSSKNSAIMIGDSHTDIQAAKNANIQAICVNYGYAGNIPLEEKTIECFSNLIKLIEFRS